MSKLLYNAGLAFQRVAASFGLFITRYNPECAYVVPQSVIWKHRQRFDTLNDELFCSIAKPVIESGKTLLQYDRLYVLWQAIKNVYSMQLVIAEVGSYRGGSAYFIASAFKALAGQEFPVHIFDTFEGHPHRKNSEFDPVHKPGMFNDTNYEDVKMYLSTFNQLKIHKGDFSESVKTLGDMTFSFAHIDVDVYHTTLDCLKYFGPRLASGGVIVVDDYGANKCPGVDRAVLDYLSRERQFQVWHMQTEQVVLIKR